MGATALLLGCVAAAALLLAGPAGAYSRGFLIKNLSDRTLVLNSVSTSLPPEKSFEGRPADGSRLSPGASQRFELKWYFGWYPNIVSANYQIEGVGSFYVRLESDGAETHSLCARELPANLRCTTSKDDTVSIRNG